MNTRETALALVQMAAHAEPSENVTPAWLAEVHAALIEAVEAAGDHAETALGLLRIYLKGRHLESSAEVLSLFNEISGELKLRAPKSPWQEGRCILV